LDVKQASIPHWVEPQLATLAKVVPDGDCWSHELKIDGYRFLGRLDGGDAHLTSRRARNWSAEFHMVVEAMKALRAQSALVDGEVAAFLPDGRSSFQALQNVGRGAVLRYVLFDLLFLDGEDLRDRPLEERRERLRDLIAGSPLAAPALTFSEHIVGRGAEVWAGICKMPGVEGIVSKRRGSRHRGGRNGDWLKVKQLQREDFVVGGYTASDAGARSGACSSAPSLATTSSSQVASARG
jgi:bifunctional non-homologous end joining protein LigD